METNTTRHLVPTGAARRIHRLLAILVSAVLAAALGAWPQVAAATPPPLLRPVEGRLLRPFDAPEQAWSAGHRGADLFAMVGTPVLAAADGRVAFVGTVVDREVLSIDHDADPADLWRTTYEPVRASVRPGQRVRRGQVVGWVMASDECLLNCLHWGLRQERDHYRDPMAWLAASGARLVPAGTRPRSAPPPAPAEMIPLLRMGAAPPSSNGLVRPVPGPVTSPFGMRLHPVLHAWKLHDGVDYGAPCGTPVVAAASGRVVLVEHNIAYGLRVMVDHQTIGGHRVRTSYNHLSSTNLSTGQAVTQRQPVGRVGSTGYSTGCHLHFMVWRDGEVVDPTGQL